MCWPPPLYKERVADDFDPARAAGARYLIFFELIAENPPALSFTGGVYSVAAVLSGALASNKMGAALDNLRSIS